VLLKADKLKSEMQWIYSAGKLCNRPSDIGTERADKCYALDPGYYYCLLYSITPSRQHIKHTEIKQYRENKT